MDLLLLDCDSIRVTDLSALADEAKIICSANSLMKLPIIFGERTGYVAPSVKNGSDFMLVAMLSKHLTIETVGTVTAVTRDIALATMIGHLCKLSDVDCNVHSRLSDIGVVSQDDEYNEFQHRKLKSAVWNLFIIRKWLTLCMIRTHLQERHSCVRRAVDDLAAEGKVFNEHGQLWRLVDL